MLEQAVVHRERGLVGARGRVGVGDLGALGILRAVATRIPVQDLLDLLERLPGL